MHSLSCFFLLHHHFEATTISTDSASVSSRSINDDRMSETSDNAADHLVEETSDELVSPTPVPVIEPEQDELPSDATVNPVDEESQFIYQEETQSLFCIGSNFGDIPQSIIDAYASKTKVELRYNQPLLIFMTKTLFRFWI